MILIKNIAGECIRRKVLDFLWLNIGWRLQNGLKYLGASHLYLLIIIQFEHTHANFIIGWKFRYQTAQYFILKKSKG